MKIAVLVSNPCVIDARVIRISEAEKNLDYEVKVFATLKGQVLVNEERNGVQYKRLVWDLSAYCRKFIPKFIKYKRLKGFLVKKMAKFLKYYSYRDTFLKDVIDFKPDIVHSHDLVCLPLGVEIKKLTGAKLIYDAHELEVFRNPPMPWHEKMYTSYIEKKYSKNVDCIITVNDSIANILKKTLSITNVYTIRNTPIVSPYKGKSLRRKINLVNNEKILLYVGKVSFNRGVEWVLEQMELMPLDMHFVCVGHRDDRIAEKLIQLAKNKNLINRFHLVDPVPHEQVVEFIKDANIGVCAINPVSKSYYYSLPNKVFEMSIAGLPIIATDLPEIRKFLDEIGNGYYFSPDEKSKISTIVNSIFKKIEDDNNIFNNIATKAKKSSWEYESKKIKKVLDALK